MSCLFNSLSYHIKLDSQQIRQLICDYLRHNKPIIDGMETQAVLDLEAQDYVQKMRSASTWGGAIEIQCACNIWHTKINVFNQRDNTTIEFLPLDGNFLSVISLSWNGSHFEPIK